MLLPLQIFPHKQVMTTPVIQESRPKYQFVFSHNKNFIDFYANTLKQNKTKKNQIYSNYAFIKVL